MFNQFIINNDNLGSGAYEHNGRDSQTEEEVISLLERMLTETREVDEGDDSNMDSAADSKPNEARCVYAPGPDEYNLYQVGQTQTCVCTKF